MPLTCVQSCADDICLVQVVSCVQEGGSSAYAVALSPRQYVTGPLPHTQIIPLRHLACMAEYGLRQR